jgi:hypothetical protein
VLGACASLRRVRSLCEPRLRWPGWPRGPEKAGGGNVPVGRTVLVVPKPPIVSLRPRTDDDLDLLFEIAADLDTWEERTPQPPRPLTRERFDARLARAADDDGPEAAVSLVVDVDGIAVGTAALFDFDLLARHAEAGSTGGSAVGLLRGLSWSPN